MKRIALLRTASWLVGLASVAAACSSNSSQGSYYARSPQPYTAPPTYAASGGGAAASSHTTYVPSVEQPTTTGQGFAWQPTLPEARSLARSTRRMVFIEAGREACGNCQALKRRIIPTPEMSAALGAVAVGYYDDIDATPYSEAFNTLQRNLPGAAVLPLCGFFTPDMQWVSGFSGHTDAGQMRQYIATAEATHRRTAMLDEGGMTPGTVAPAPTFPDAELAAVASTPAGDGEIDLGTDVSAAKVTPAFDTTRASNLAPYAPPPAPPQPLVETATPTGTSAAPAAPPAPAAPALTVPPAPLAAPPVATETPAAIAPSAAPPAMSETPQAAQAALKRAADALASRDYAGARSILAGLKAQVRGQPEEREADKGEVAIYDLRRADAASGATQAAIRAQARQDLHDTVWATLFN